MKVVRGSFGDLSNRTLLTSVLLMETARSTNTTALLVVDAVTGSV